MQQAFYPHGVADHGIGTGMQELQVSGWVVPVDVAGIAPVQYHFDGQSARGAQASNYGFAIEQLEDVVVAAKEFLPYYPALLTVEFVFWVEIDDADTGLAEPPGVLAMSEGHHVYIEPHPLQPEEDLGLRPYGVEVVVVAYYKDLHHLSGESESIISQGIRIED